MAIVMRPDNPARFNPWEWLGMMLQELSAKR
jgi:hypothetical protein